MRYKLTNESGRLVRATVDGAPVPARAEDPQDEEATAPEDAPEEQDGSDE